MYILCSLFMSRPKCFRKRITDINAIQEVSDFLHFAFPSWKEKTGEVQIKKSLPVFLFLFSLQTEKKSVINTILLYVSGHLKRNSPFKLVQSNLPVKEIKLHIQQSITIPRRGIKNFFFFPNKKDLFLLIHRKHCNREENLCNFPFYFKNLFDCIDSKKTL